MTANFTQSSKFSIRKPRICTKIEETETMRSKGMNVGPRFNKTSRITPDLADITNSSAEKREIAEEKKEQNKVAVLDQQIRIIINV